MEVRHISLALPVGGVEGALTSIESINLSNIFFSEVDLMNVHIFWKTFDASSLGKRNSATFDSPCNGDLCC